MDRNRRIILAILLLLLVSCIFAIIDIGLTIQKKDAKDISLALPSVGPGVGVIKIYGAISVSGSGSYLNLTSGTDSIIKKLTKFENNKRIKAIVIRINSPGGSSASVEEVFQKLMDMRKKNILLVASMGEVAASGAYYLASACNYIFANNSTLTGSIGAMTVSFNFKDLYKKIGVKKYVIKSGKYKDILSDHRELKDDERDLLKEMIESAYLKFLKDVSLGRNMPISDIKPYADGRIISGQSALKYGLIDSIGTFENAVSYAKNQSKLPEDAPVYEMENPIEQILMSIDTKFGNRSIESRIKQKKYSVLEYMVEL